MEKKRFKGIMGAPVTPFTQDTKLDLETFAKQVDFLIKQGVPMIAHPMHIGESVSLTRDEQRALAKCLIQAASGRVPVFVNVSSAGTDLALDLARYCEKEGATGIVLLPPYYWRPAPKDVIDHFMTVGSGVGIKMIAYNNVGAVHLEIGGGELAHLIERLPNFVGLKDASFHMKYFTEACRISSEMNPDFSCYTGVEYLLSSIPLGGSGAFSACAEVAPRFTLKLYDACVKGDVAAARPMQYKMSKLLNLLMQVYPSTIKYAMEVMGRPVGETRQPIPHLSGEAKKKVRDSLAELGVLAEEAHGW
jgi:4-hydroxy-tetrahydrodipicolinate synthase